MWSHLERDSCPVLAVPRTSLCTVTGCLESSLYLFIWLVHTGSAALSSLCLCHQNCPFPFKLFFHPLLLLIHFLKMGQPWEKFKYLPLNTSFFSYLYKAMEEISRFPLAEMPHFHSRLWPANPLHQIEVELSGVTWRNISIHGLRRVLYASRYHFYKCY